MMFHQISALKLLIIFWNSRSKLFSLESVRHLTKIYQFTPHRTKAGTPSTTGTTIKTGRLDAGSRDSLSTGEKVSTYYYRKPVQ